MTPEAAEAHLAFLRRAGALKDVMRNSWTRAGRHESTAEHSWRLALMAITLADDLPGIDLGRLIQILLVHDLGEAIHGDTPAPRQTGDKTAGERADLATLIECLPASAAARISALWEEYAAAASPEARLAKGLDRLETVLQHTEGANPADFDYVFNLTYGQDRTAAHPVTAALRIPVDAETRARADARDPA